MNQRVLVCDMTAFTPDERKQHAAATERLLQHARVTELADGYIFTIDREHVSPADVARWTADESRCCPAVDFHLELPYDGPLTLRLDGGPDVKQFIAAELGLSQPT